MSRDEIRAAVSDRIAVIATLIGEAGGEPLESIVAVGCVIRNRATHPNWWGRHGYRSVCLAPSQFSCWWGQDANTERVYQAADGLLRKQPLGEQTAESEIAWIAEGIIGEQIRDITAKSDHYVTRRLARSPAAPAWAKNRPYVTEIGAHRFYRLEL